MTFEESKKLVNEAINTKDPKRVRAIVEEIKEDELINPFIIEAIQSGITPEMFNKVFGGGSI